LVGLTGCLETEESGFPTNFIRISDGAEIGIGTSMSDIENIIERLPEFYEDDMRSMFGLPETAKVYFGGTGATGSGATAVIYNDAGEARIILNQSPAWTIGGFTADDNIQSVIDSGRFEHFTHNSEQRYIRVMNNPENLEYVILFNYIESGRIIAIFLQHMHN